MANFFRGIKQKMLAIKYKNIYFKLFFLLNFNICTANTAQEAFLQANKLCMEGEFAKALDLYDTIDTKGSAVWYNMGNCYFYQKNLPKAIWAWLNACKTGKGKIAVQSEQNIAVAQNLLEIKNWSGYYPKIDFLTMQVWLLFCIFVLFIILIKKCQSKTKWWLLFFFLEMGFLGIAWWYEKSQRSVWVVAQKTMNLMAGPANEYHVLDSVLAGQILSIKYCLDEWCYIDDGNMQGWLTKKDLLIV